MVVGTGSLQFGSYRPIDSAALARCFVAVLGFACGQSGGAAPAQASGGLGGAGNFGVSGGSAQSGGSSHSSGSGGSSGSSNSSANGGVSSSCPELSIEETPGIVATLGGQTIEFRQQVLWYDGRPPHLDLSALSGAEAWRSLRIVLDPEDSTVMPGNYRSGPNNVTYVLAMNAAGEYSSIDNDASLICVREAGSGPGARVSGTFSALLQNHDGTQSVAASGAFFGAIGSL